MSTRSADSDTALVDGLSAGALRWIRSRSPYLDSPSGHAELPAVPRAKALLQLALLLRCWERTGHADPGPDEVRATVERVWRSPRYPRRLGLDPRYAQPFQLMYAALAPAGITGSPYPAVLARLAADGFLTPRRKSPYLHLETRYYADLAGVAHQLHSYRELYEASVLARHDGDGPVADLDVCEVTHTVFYLSDFGFRDPGLAGEELKRARRLVHRLTDLCVGRGEWDLTGKLVLAQLCLGADPLRTPSGAAGLRLLAGAQSPGGAIPGRSAGRRAAAAEDTVEFFREAYQATLVAALTAVMVSYARTGAGTDGAVGADGRHLTVRGAR
ncbi:hypothetical protein [Streptomyces sp. HPF1205]|uniref:DUF6895 family protein n=1 Tax=Streptomyces sp. HPF1205 TaxID=2873262 RepID=UPI001CED3E3C|nr:hypothetical protein [Streptomyces sp. HPF1205]